MRHPLRGPNRRRTPSPALASRIRPAPRARPRARSRRTERLARMAEGVGQNRQASGRVGASARRLPLAPRALSRRPATRLAGRAKSGFESSAGGCEAGWARSAGQICIGPQNRGLQPGFHPGAHRFDRTWVSRCYPGRTAVSSAGEVRCQLEASCGVIPGVGCAGAMRCRAGGLRGVRRRRLGRVKTPARRPPPLGPAQFRLAHATAPAAHRPSSGLRSGPVAARRCPGSPSSSFQLRRSQCRVRRGPAGRSRSHRRP
jgi:hypothetical protein